MMAISDVKIYFRQLHFLNEFTSRDYLVGTRIREDGTSDDYLYRPFDLSTVETVDELTDDDFIIISKQNVEGDYETKKITPATLITYIASKMPLGELPIQFVVGDDPTNPVDGSDTYVNDVFRGYSKEQIIIEFDTFGAILTSSGFNIIEVNGEKAIQLVDRLFTNGIRITILILGRKVN